MLKWIIFSCWVIVTIAGLLIFAGPTGKTGKAFPITIFENPIIQTINKDVLQHIRLDVLNGFGNIKLENEISKINK